MEKLSYDGPIVLAILDGVGLAPDGPGNAVSRARTPFLGRAARDYLHLALNASGEAVGLTAAQMGNSEVGHMTMGAGQIIKSGLARVNEAFESGEIVESEAWQGVLDQILGKSRNDNPRAHTLHFAGIFSDGGVHSHLDHLKMLVVAAYRDGVRKMRIHAVFDGRDVPPQSEPKYIEEFEDYVEQFDDADIRIASGGGRMVTVADRYQNDWQIVKRGWDMMVNGEADYYFKTPGEAIQMLRRINPKVQDQNLSPFVIVDDKEQPVGKVEKGDAVVYFDFRADRAIEIAMAFTYWDFPYFDRGDYKPSDIYFAGMTEYNSDTHVPEHRLMAPVQVQHTLNEFLGERGVSQLALSETVKFGHVTYYFDGGSYVKVPGEEFLEVNSTTSRFETRPWMRSAEIADKTIEKMDNYKFIRLNFPGGDMVGHSADMEATVIAMEAIDLALGRIAAAVDKLGGALVIVADHGNAEELVDANGNKKTSHTTNRVPFIIYDNSVNRGLYQSTNVPQPGLANLAATLAVMLGLEPDANWEPSLIERI